MQAETTRHVSPPPRNSTNKALLFLLLLALIGLGIQGYYAGWFKQAAGKIDELITTWQPAATPVASPPAAAPAVAAAAPVAPAARAGDVAATSGQAGGGGLDGGDVLMNARAAFAAGDINAAIDAYSAVIANNPYNFGALGELGNVFYAVGMVQQAALAYYEAASKAIEQSRPEIAESLLPAIMQGNPMLAGQLSERLFDTGRHADLTPQPWQQAPVQQAPVQQPAPGFQPQQQPQFQPGFQPWQPAMPQQPYR